MSDVLGISFFLLIIASWIRHFVWTVVLLSSGDMVVSQGVLAVLGAIVAPFGIIHGFLLFIGVAI